MAIKIVIGILIVASISVAIMVVLKKHNNSEPIVLGQQFANAVAKEQERLTRNLNIPSPMPGEKYRRQKGRWNLINPELSELDTNLRELCSFFVSKSRQEQSEFRSALSLDDFYTLLEFARRSAVFALRSKDFDILSDGLTSIAMIEAERTDFRDILVALSLLHYSATRIEMNTSAIFKKAAEMAEPRTSAIIRTVSERELTLKILRSSCGYIEVNTEYGYGFTQCSNETYNPTLDLLGVSMKIASAFEKDVYYVDGIELASFLPLVWLESPENKSLSNVLEHITGGVTINCQLGEDKCPNAGAQQFTLFLVELDSQRFAQSLLEMSRKKIPNNYCMLGFSNERLFALLIARSVILGGEAFETNASIQRFKKPIDQILQEAMPL